jgi:hypothetical protein
MASNAAGFVSLGVLLPIAILWGMVGFAAQYWQLPWLPLALGLAILAGGIKLYSYSLDRAAAYTYEHIEEIAGNLGA